MTNPVIFDEQLRQYTISYEGIQFCWDEKPTDANILYRLSFYLYLIQFHLKWAVVNYYDYLKS